MTDHLAAWLQATRDRTPDEVTHLLGVEVTHLFDVVEGVCRSLDAAVDAAVDAALRRLVDEDTAHTTRS